MRKTTLVLLIAAAALIVVGLVVFCLGMMLMNWDFTKLSTAEYFTNEYEITEDYDNISVSVDTADVIFLPSESGITKVSCYEKEIEKHSVKVVNGTLTVNVESNNKKWYQYISFNGSLAKVTVYLPKAEYEALVLRGGTGRLELPNTLSFKSIDASLSTGDAICNSSAEELVKIKTSTGSVLVDGISTSKLDVSVSTGRVSLSNVNCGGEVNVRLSSGDVNLKTVRCASLNARGTTGDIRFDDVVASDAFNLKVSTGDVTMLNCDAGEIFVTAGTGDVNATLLSDKVYITNTSTGKINVPSSISGGRCEITTTTGDIKITVKQ